MENEVDLREIFQVLWRGKYIILVITAFFALAAVFYIFYMITPAYEYSALLDLASFQMPSKEILALIEQNQVVDGAVKGLAEEPDLPVQSIKISIVNENLLQIRVEHTDPDICVSAVKQIGLAVVETLSEYRFRQIKLEKERYEKLLGYLDETAAEYLLSRDEQFTELLEEDPVLKRLLEEKASCLVNMKLLNFDLKELEEHLPVDNNNWIDDQNETADPVSSNKKFYLVAAVLLGLMLSISIVFIRHYFKTQVVYSTKVEHDHNQ
jgi:chain length determinant protein (polysaccharide antigen chain regulator)